MAENSEHKSFARRLAVSLVAALLFGSVCYAFSLIFSGESRKPVAEFLTEPFPFRELLRRGVESKPFLGGAFVGLILGLLGDKEEWYRALVGSLTNLSFNLVPSGHKHFATIPAPKPFDPLKGSPFTQPKDVENTSQHQPPSHPTETHQQADLEGHSLNWVTPAIGSPREAIWSQIEEVIRHGSSDGRLAPWRKPHNLTHPFTWVILVGRSGAGKSRTAVEFCRNFLGRRQELDNATPRERFRIHAEAALRRAWPWSPRTARFYAGGTGTEASSQAQARSRDDPWDASWLDFNGSRSDLLKILRDWKPIRPTVFLLDDPMGKLASQVVEALSEGSSHDYRFPVRLVITSQAIPEDLELGEDPFAPHWNPDQGALIALHPETRLSIAEILLLINSIRPDHVVVPDEAPQQIFELTEGVPMLVELAIRHFFQNHSLEGLDASELIRLRAQRVFDIITKSTKGELTDTELHHFLCILASGTLANHHPFKGIMKDPYNPKWMDQFETVLNKYFNISSEDGHPTIRPERVGDAFVRIVLDQVWLAEERRRQIVATAWDFSPEGVLRSIERCAAIDDKLGALLRQPLPPDVTVEPADYALSLLKATTHIYFDQPQVFDDGSKAFSATSAAIDALSPEQAADIFPEAADLVLKPGTAISNIRRDGAGCALLLLRRAFQSGGNLGARSLNSTTRRLAEIFVDVNIGGVTVRSTSAFENIALGLLEVARNAAAQETTTGLESAQLFLLAARSTFGEIGSFEQYTIPARELTLDLSEISYAPLMAATAWSTVCSYRAEAHDAEGASEAAERVESICIGHENEPDFQLQLAVAWSYTAFAFSHTKIPYDIRALVRRIEGIAEYWKDSRGVQLALAGSWCSLAYSHWRKEDLQQTQLSASRVEAIVKPYPNDRRFQLDLAETRVSLSAAFANISDYDNAELTAVQLEKIAAPYGEDHRFQVALADIWCNVSATAANLSDIAHTLEAQRRVENITARYKEVKEFQIQRVAALRNVAVAYRNAGDARDTLRAAQQVDSVLDEIASFQIIGPEIVIHQAWAWCFVCDAFKRSNYSEAKAAYNRVRQVATPYLLSDDRDKFAEVCAIAEQHIEDARAAHKALNHNIIINSFTSIPNPDKQQP